jgi:zinc/manganese transport system permease protein
MPKRMPTDTANPTLSWDLGRDVAQVLEYHFMINALLAGSVVAVLAALAGWLMVLRREAFAGHTLSVMAFPGAGAALLAGVAPAWGYFVFCAGGALAIARVYGGARVSWSEQSAGIGAVQALALALGFLFVSLYGGVLGDLEALLFGDLLGVGDGEVLLLAIVAAVTIAALAWLGRALVFASVDPDVAAARGVPVALMSAAFLLLLGLAVAATSQVTGALLVFALLVAPAASAQALTSRPVVSLALGVAFALLVVWLGLGIAYFSVYPAGFFVATAAFVLYVLARAIAFVRSRLDAGDGAAEPLVGAEGVI